MTWIMLALGVLWFVAYTHTHAPQIDMDKVGLETSMVYGFYAYTCALRRALKKRCYGFNSISVASSSHMHLR